MQEPLPQTTPAFFSFCTRPSWLPSPLGKAKKAARAKLKSASLRYEESKQGTSLQRAKSLPATPRQDAAQQVHQWLFHGAGLAVQPGVQSLAGLDDVVLSVSPRVHTEDNSCAVLFGHVNSDDLLSSTSCGGNGISVGAHHPHGGGCGGGGGGGGGGNALRSASSLAAAVLHLYLECGAGNEALFLSELQLQGSLFIFDGSSKQAFAARDPSSNEELFWRKGNDGTAYFTNTLAKLPDGDEADDWSLVPSGHYVAGASPKLFQYALTPQQLQRRTRRESLEAETITSCLTSDDEESD